MLNQGIHKVILSIFFGFFILLSSSSVTSETPDKAYKSEILTIGTSPIVAGNVAVARKTAIGNALTKGMEEYLIRRLGGNSVINNFPRLINEVIPKATESVQNFRILEEEQVGKQYKILVRLRVNDKLIDENLREMGLIIMEGPPIKILFLVSEHDAQKKNISYWWHDPESSIGLTSTELALLRVFEERGFNPINRLLTVPEAEYSAEMKRLDLSDEEVFQWGELFSADVVIHGKSKIVEKEGASLILKVYNLEKRVVLFEGGQIERIAPASKQDKNVIALLEKAIRNIMARFGPDIIKSVQKSGPEIITLEMELRRLKSFNQFRSFKDFLLTDVEGVNSVVQTKIRGQSMFVLVEFSGTMDTFLDKISRHGNLPFRADISETDHDTIVVSIK